MSAKKSKSIVLLYRYLGVLAAELGRYPTLLVCALPFFRFTCAALDERIVFECKIHPIIEPQYLSRLTPPRLRSECEDS